MNYLATRARPKMQTQPSDRRNAPRLDINLPIRFRADHWSEFEQAVLMNRSRKGLSFFTQRPLPVGTWVSIVIDVSDADIDAVELRALIIRVESAHRNGFKYACRIDRAVGTDRFCDW